MKFIDYYKVLGVKKSSTSSEIRKAYLSLAKEHHPDRGGNQSRMDRVNQAYEVLKDETKRHDYDEIHRAKYANKKDDFEFDFATSEHVLVGAELTNKIKLWSAVTLGVLSLLVISYIKIKPPYYLILLYPLFTAGRNLYIYLTDLYLSKRQSIKHVKLWHSAGIILVAIILIIIFVFSLGARTRNFNRGSTINTVTEKDISELENLRVDYEVCSSELSVISNKLQLLNRQIDSGAQTSNTSIDNQRQEREKLLSNFDTKSAECRSAQSSYDTLLNKYKTKEKQ